MERDEKSSADQGEPSSNQSLNAGEIIRAQVGLIRKIVDETVRLLIVAENAERQSNDAVKTAKNS